MQMFSCKSQSARLRPLLILLTPAIKEIYTSDLNLPKDQQNPIFRLLFDKLVRGLELVEKCEDTKTLNPTLNHQYVLQIEDLVMEIECDMGLLGDYTLVDTRALLAELKSEAADTSKELENSIKQVSLFTNNAYNNGYGESQNFVGLEKPIGDLKKHLFNTEVSVVGVQCMGGGGKTTLALALCSDPQIKDHFGENVVFITVSQSPNGKRRTDFQKVEDAHIHLQQQLLKESKPTLVILDDVRSRESLEKLQFERPGYKTLITTRDSSIIPKIFSTQLYQSPLRGYEDVLPLFCFWAF